MKALLFGATLFALAPTAAMAAGSSTECHGGWFGTGNGGWGPKRYIYECQSAAESKYGTARTVCSSAFGCQTTSEAKPQPRPPQPPQPILPPSSEKDRMTGVVVMRGMPDR